MKFVSPNLAGSLIRTLNQEPPPLILPQDWPLWAKALKRLAKPEDRGIGDVVARIIGDPNSEAFKRWHKKTFGKDCGCDGRQARWNTQYPLQHSRQFA